MRSKRTNDPKLFNVVVCEDDRPSRQDLLGAGWIAEVTAPDPKLRFKREFVRHQRGDNMWYDLRVDRPYEYRGLYTGGSKYAFDKRGGAKGFFRISPDGEMVTMTEAEVRDWLRAAVTQAAENPGASTETQAGNVPTDEFR